MFDMEDTTFCDGRVLIVCHFLQESSTVKESSLHEIRNADTAFLLGGQRFQTVLGSLHYLNRTPHLTWSDLLLEHCYYICDLLYQNIDKYFFVKAPVKM